MNLYEFATQATDEEIIFEMQSPNNGRVWVCRTTQEEFDLLNANGCLSPPVDDHSSIADFRTHLLFAHWATQ
jgi:hypothetical protein